MYYIGVDLGGTNIAVGIVNENYEIVKKGSTPTKPERGCDPIIEDMGAHLQKASSPNAVLASSTRSRMPKRYSRYCQQRHGYRRILQQHPLQKLPHRS